MCANFFKQICCVLFLSLMLSGCGGGASGGGGGANVTTISWAPPVYGTANVFQNINVVAGPPDNQTGGWNLATKTWTSAGSTADIAFDAFGMIGAVGIARSQAGFNTTPEPALTYGRTFHITGAGDVLVIVLRNGKHAKLRIDSVTSGSVMYSFGSISFSYLLEQGVAVTATPICTAPPSAPTAFAASQTAYGTVTFSWQPSAGASSYTLYAQGTPGVTTASSMNSITTWQTNAQGQAVYTLSNVPLGTYYGAMTATNPCGESVLSAEGGPTNVVTVAPSAPTVYTPAAGNAKATLSWASQAGATSYNTYWSTTPGVTKLNGFKIANMNSGQSFNLVNGTTYYIVVTAVNSAGESAESNQVSVTPYDPMVPRLDSLRAVRGLGAMVEVCLTDRSGGSASGWNVYRSVTPGVTATPANLVSNNGLVWMVAGNSRCFTDNTGLVAGTTYYYRATSVTAAGAESTPSNELAIPF